jgi:hypothetical protein
MTPHATDPKEGCLVPEPARPTIDLQEVRTRNTHARHIVAGFARSQPTLAEMWRILDAALADTAALAYDYECLADQVRALRLDVANLLAAGRAVLTAHNDGEPDPLFHLRDELGSRGLLPRPNGGRA